MSEKRFKNLQEVDEYLEEEIETEKRFTDIWCSETGYIGVTDYGIDKEFTSSKFEDFLNELNDENKELKKENEQLRKKLEQIYSFKGLNCRCVNGV